MSARARNRGARAESIEAEAWAQVQSALPSDARERVGSRVQRRGAATLFAAPGADVAVLNRVIGLGFDSPLTRNDLASIGEWFTGAGVKRWLVEWSPAASPENADELLVNAGGAAMPFTVKLYRELDDLPEPSEHGELTIREIGANDADRFEAVVAEPLGLPGLIGSAIRATVGTPSWHFYLASEAGRPVAGGALFVSGNGAWLGLAATSVAARGRGAQLALLHRRLHDARRLGCRWASAETRESTDAQPNPSLRNMIRSGFGVLYRRPKYLFGERVV